MFADPVAAVKQHYCYPAVAAEYAGQHLSLALANMPGPRKGFVVHDLLGGSAGIKNMLAIRSETSSNTRRGGKRLSIRYTQAWTSPLFRNIGARR